jgi:hypothetical protein
VPTLGPRVLGRDEPEQLFECGHLEPPVEGGTAQLGQPLARAQRLELGEREVLGEPAADRSTVDRLRSPAGRELRVARDVGRPEISFSWRQTRTPSFVATRSGSTKSAPCSIARR